MERASGRVRERWSDGGSGEQSGGASSEVVSLDSPPRWPRGLLTLPASDAEKGGREGGELLIFGWPECPSSYRREKITSPLVRSHIDFAIRASYFAVGGLGGLLALRQAMKHALAHRGLCV